MDAHLPEWNRGYQLLAEPFSPHPLTPSTHTFYSHLLLTPSPHPLLCTGYQLLAQMGWRRHTGLGRRGEGRVEPVRISDQLHTTGLGKESEYAEKAEEATESRRAMTAERCCRLRAGPWTPFRSRTR